MKVSLIGTGSWGLTIAKLLQENGNEVLCWTHSEEEYKILSETNSYPDKLPGITLPESVQYTLDLQEAFAAAEMVVIALPSVVLRQVSQKINEVKAPEQVPVFVSLTKGITNDTLQRMSEVMLEEISWLTEDKMCVLSGPSHAEEVARQMTTAVSLACSEIDNARIMQKAFSNDYFRVYIHTDVVGIELAGALKNVIAIATGILDGLGLGDNTKGALITRGLVEITRLGEAMGAHHDTFPGLSGMGDLFTTCISKHSRNRHVGEEIGKGKTLDQTLASMNMVAEGVVTCKSAVALAKKMNVEMPIVSAVYGALFNDLSAREAIVDLMHRSLKTESVV